MYKIIFLLACFLFTISATLLGQVSQAAEESTYIEIAKLRKYPSGADESDLKVQPVLNRSQNKKKKTINSDISDGF